MTVNEITAADLKARLDAGADCLVIDIREEWERDIATFPGARVVSFDDLPDVLADEPKEREMVTVCHHGGRSFTAAMLLERAGFVCVANLAGGIDGWAREVDPSVPTY